MKKQKIYGTYYEYLCLKKFASICDELRDAEICIIDKKNDYRHDTDMLLNKPVANLYQHEIDFIIQYGNEIALLGLMARNYKIKPAYAANS